ncbi:HXXEE domain-containing protein [Bacillus sp. Marseille-P3661]|uniref:HXXEE domain-containing protein n=1 Tax=Bacillus sp. Marseille-P3661 TaxID=1936234 RepID=UPI000C8325E2|nr:HXXEE domain-containing protein [Bacillus sp. Marseille-P3661]
MNNPFLEFPLLKKLILLFPILYLIHDIEEILTVEKFLIDHAEILPISMTSEKFTFAFILLWILSAIGCYQALNNRKYFGMEPITFLSFLVPGVLLANGIGHLLQFIFFRDYVPGILTSIVIIYPYSFFTLRYLLKNELLTFKRFGLFFLMGFILQGPFALAAHLVAKLALN